MNNVECNLCGSSRSRPALTIPDFWMERNDVKAIFVRCEDCGLIYQNPQPDDSEEKGLYPPGYRAAQRARTNFSRYGLMKRAKLITRHKRQGTLLDIGCGDGSFIQLMQQELHWKAIGIEAERKLEPTVLQTPAESPADDGAPLDIRYGQLEELQLAADSVDAVSLWDVLEHLRNPKSTLREVRRILKPDGILVLRLPNLDSWDARFFGKYWAGYDAPRHFFVFSQKTLTRMLEQAGFSIIESRSDIGNYLNFVKSVQFWLTGMGTSLFMRNMLLAILRSRPARLLAFPFNTLKDSGMHGSEMVIVATHRLAA